METPLSGSHLGPHCKRITRSVQQGRLQRSSLFLVHALQRRLLLLQLRIRTEAFDDEYKYVLTEQGSPFKGLGRTGCRRLKHDKGTVFAILRSQLIDNRLNYLRLGTTEEDKAKSDAESSLDYEDVVLSGDG